MLKKDVELKGATAVGKGGPLYLAADRIESAAPNIIEASGRVEARQAGQNFFADWLRYDAALNEVQARGQVRLEQPALLVAERIDFIDENHFNLQDATYTTCPVDNDDWFLKVRDLDIDKTRNVGTAH
ncbi:MAG: organic solvent tolerance transrane protein, partial [Proteobacteria bacterium]|nr:organic solvent tolerance transrane protein [Pseudomonadota bacterium]